MTKKKVLVCGASGFVGRNIFERLATRRDIEVWGTYLNSPEKVPIGRVFRADLTDRHRVLEVVRGFDVVINAAAVTSGSKDIVERPYVHVTDNVVMNTLLLEAVHANNIPHFIFLSCTVLYPMNLDRPVKESDMDVSQIHEKYFGGAWVKITGEKLCEFYSRLGRTRFTMMRHANVYGPYDKFDLEKSHVFGATVAKVMRAPDGGRIVVWGDGSEERDLLYVEDMVDFIELAMCRQSSNFEIVNVGSGRSVSVKELVRKIIVASAKNLSVEHDLSKPTIPSRLVLDVSSAKERFGWLPKTDLDEGIKKTLVWYRKSGEVSR